MFLFTEDLNEGKSVTPLIEAKKTELKEGINPKAHENSQQVSQWALNKGSSHVNRNWEKLRTRF